MTMIRGEVTGLTEAHFPTKSAFAVRVLDVIGASLGLAVFAPLMLLVAIAICLESGWPVIFSQDRLGRAGHRFRIYKFRKFYRDSGSSGPLLTLKNDLRLTRLGKLLDRTKLNELPQLWNVLKGDMSLVGPRPETFDFADCFAGPYGKVLDHKPGIVGPSQVFFRDEASLFPLGSDPTGYYREVLFPLKARIDMAYFQDRTVVSDLGWIVCSVMAVFGWRPLPPQMLFQRPEMSFRPEAI